MRHDYLNHLQIISGYLQLGQPEKVREYVRKVSQSLQRFNQLSRIEAPFLQSLFLYYLVTLGENDCFNLEVKGKINIGKEDDEGLTRLIGEIISPYSDNILNSLVKCRLVIESASLIRISLCREGDMAEGAMADQQARGAKKSPEALSAKTSGYVYVVTEKAEDESLNLLISREETTAGMVAEK